MPNETKTKNEIGNLFCCTISTLNGFPDDFDFKTENVWLSGRAKQFKDWAKKARAGTGWQGYDATAALCTITSEQLKAKKMLEEAGFKVLAVVPSSHLSADQVKSWKSDKDGRTVYLMGKGWFPHAIKRPTRSRAKVRP